MQVQISKQLSHTSEKLPTDMCTKQRFRSACAFAICQVSILHKSTAGRYRPVRIADGPITACCRFMKNASWVARFVTGRILDREICQVSSCEQRRLLSDCTYAQADLNLRWAHMWEGMFYYVATHMISGDRNLNLQHMFLLHLQCLFIEVALLVSRSETCYFRN